MKSKLRSSLAAALMVIAPAAALLAAAPASAQTRVIVAVDDGARHGYRHDDRWGHRPRDQRAPQIVDVTPDHGGRVDERGRTRISARFVDQGSGVAGAWLRVDGRDVTGAARFDGDRIRYREDLAPGRHVAEVMVRDRAGNVNRRAWTFFVVDRDRGDRYGPGYGYGYGYSGQQPNRW